jgi:Ca-activated chloride channel homolog
MRFEHPAFLILLLLIPVLIAATLFISRLRKKQWQAFVASRLRHQLLRTPSGTARWISLICLLLALGMFVIALARPQKVNELQAERSRGRNILIALDLSRSMMTRDVKPDRLSQAKALCYEMIDAMPSDRIGLIGFSGEPFLFAPLTVDHDGVKETIQQLDTDSIPVNGSSIAKALKKSIETLKETRQKSNGLILISDGEETIDEMDALASQLKKSNIFTFIVGVGTEQGDNVPNPEAKDGLHRDSSGRPVLSRIQTDALRKLARDSGGRFVVATSGADIPAMVHEATRGLDSFEQTGPSRLVAEEFYQWFLLPGLLLMMASVIAATRWRKIAAPVLGMFFLLGPSQPARADLRDDARLAYEHQQYEEAAKLYGKLALGESSTDAQTRYFLQQASALDQLGKGDDAIHAYSKALLSHDEMVRAAAHHGMGHLLFERGWQRLSNGAAYPEITPPRKSGEESAFKNIIRSLLGLLDQKADKNAEKDSGPPDPMADFEAMVKAQLSKWMGEDTRSGTLSEGYVLFNEVLTDWIDAIRHDNTALQLNPGQADTKHNRDLTLKYLRHLRDLLKQTQDNASQMALSPQSPGNGSPKGESDGNDGDQEGEEDGDGKGDKKSDKGKGDQKKDKPQDGPGDNRKKQSDDVGTADKSSKQGESREETARRILRENSDFEKGVATDRSLNYEQPEKDW